MTVCYFGIYNQNHTRNRLMIKGLRQNGVEVIEVNTREKSAHKYERLARGYWAVRKKCDVIVVGFPGHTVMPLAWLLAKLTGKRIVFDAFISLYDSFVFDEKKYTPGSFSARKYWFIDWLAGRMADTVLLEVGAYADYFSKTFGIPRKKFKVIWVACDDEVIYPREQKKETADFLVHFHGTYIPAQGIPTIIEAAKILEPEGVRFNIIGRLSTYGEALELVKKIEAQNINFVDFVPYATLADYMAQADVCLGMFGATGKAARAGAFKIMEALAMRKPLITGDTPAVREFLIDGENALLCRVDDPRDLADKILVLKRDQELRKRIAERGYQLFRSKMTPKALGGQFAALLAELRS